MLTSLAHYFRQKSDAVETKVNGCFAVLKRYCRAGVKAYQAARSYLAPPSEGNLFEPLTPVLLEQDRWSRYERELLHGLTSDQVRNIALTGEYGAGKSSVIRTFVDRHPEFTYAFVSLATFGKDNTDAESGTAKEATTEFVAETSPSAGKQEDKKADVQKSDTDLLTRIEETIVQQLLYAVPTEKLPKTRLKRIAHASGVGIWWKTLCYIVLILAGLRLYLPTLEKPPKLDSTWLLDCFYVMPPFLAFAVTAFGCVYFLHAGLRLLALFSIDGFTIKGGKLETTHHGSVLHKNIDEIIYCFERSTINVVVIEDLDRFGIHDVFTRLREINFIIKQSPQIKRPIYFVYALRDEMFVVGEKTKFFDLIIPVIPVINSENSREKMVELLKGRHFKNKSLDDSLNPVLLETVCYYIDDMRLIKNIVNEFDIFSSILATSLTLDANKLFAIVAIRNLHPRAYAELVKRRGPIYGVIQGFDLWKADSAHQYQIQIEDLQNQRNEKLYEVAKNVGELRAYVWFELIKLSGANTATHIQVGNSICNAMEFITDATFDQIFSQGGKIRPVTNDHYGNSSATGNPVATADLLASTKYQVRHERLNDSLDRIDKEIAQLKIKSENLTRLSFRSAARDGYGEAIRELLHGHDVVTYLIRAGYLDTDYSDYLGYFYEGSLTPADKNLILEFRRGALADTATKVDNPEAVLRKLDSDDLNEGRGILGDLIHYLSGRPQSQAESHHEDAKLALILNNGLDLLQIERMAKAIEELLHRSDHDHLIQAINRLQPRLFRKLFESTELFEGGYHRQLLVRATFDSLSEFDVKNLSNNEQENLYPVVASLEDVTLLMEGLEKSTGAWSWLRARPVAFAYLSDSITPEDLKKLVKWRCLEVNLTTLSLLCTRTEEETRSKAKGVEGNMGSSVSYRRLSALGIEGLDELLFESPDEFVAELVEQGGIVDESAESLAHVFSQLNGDDEVTQQLFKCTECQLNHLEDAPTTLWAKVLEDDRVIQKAEAVWIFFEKIVTPSRPSKEGGADADHDSILTAFITRHAGELRADLWNEGHEGTDLARYLITSEGISNDCLDSVLKGQKLKDSSILSNPMPDGRWAMLVKSDFLPFSIEFLQAVAAQQPMLEGHYLAKRWDQARNHINFSSLPLQSIVTLSNNSKPSLLEKIQMWSCTSLNQFESNTTAVESLATTCRTANAQSQYFPESFMPVLQTLGAEARMLSEARAEILIQILPSATWTIVSSILGKLVEEDFKNFNPRMKKISVPNTETNMRLVYALKSAGYLGTVKPAHDVIKATTKPSSMRVDSGVDGD
ncbi:hypothetical protein HX870_26590 [Pseudomonas gingeri]|uniref:YobI family P-loop NTPase n=1 Tax=Pseudomonas gingeri TaxID=117681 RepID=UPI0015A08A7C|nr:hypothetical protein [Pseudomonas gingeri]NWD71171.1 hypothetical protein [Pseudomonas gingeri]